MESLEAVESAFSCVLSALAERKIPTIRAQTTVGASGPVIWLDVNTEDDAVDAAERLVESCSVRFAAVADAVDGMVEERSILLVGDVVVGLRFGVDVDEDEVEDLELGDSRGLEIEQHVRAHSASVIDRVASAQGVEPSDLATIGQLFERAVDDLGPDEAVIRAVRARRFELTNQIVVEMRRLHQKGFADRAAEIADALTAEQPSVLAMNKTMLRPLVHDYLRSMDAECATQRAGEPVVAVIHAKSKQPAAGLF